MPPSTADAFPDIGDYAFISDCHSLALITSDASVEWACFHRFDSRPVFGRILDRTIGGYFRIAPSGESTSTRRYLPGTNVLETRFETPTGVATVTDCLPVGAHPLHAAATEHLVAKHLLLRVVRGVEGRVDLSLEMHPRFEYGLTTPFVEPLADDLVRASGSADAVLLQSELGPLQCIDGGAQARATVEAGDVRVVALTADLAHHLRVQRHDRAELLAALDATVRFWTQWSAGTVYDGPYADMVQRSALVLKGLQYARTGAVIAAATTSLPEELGGERNWDYRYTWVRDSAALIVALASVGHTAEAQAMGEWLLRTTAGRADELQIMYGIGGERLLHEAQLDHLSGYCDSKPVRVGNGAWDQLQIDTVGEIVGAAWFVREVLGATSFDARRAAFMTDVVERAIQLFEEPDEGIWEVRGGRQHFIFSKLMAWLAVDRGLALAEQHDAAAPEVLDRWRAALVSMRARIEDEGVDPATGAFTQAFGSTNLDASALQIGLRGFVADDDPRTLATIEQIDQHLTHNGHVYRYRGVDGLAGDEGTFVFCTLWLVSALARSGQVDRARERFETVLACANDLGLIAEEIEADSGRMIGNYPQAFSHIGVIGAAMSIHLAESGLTSTEALNDVFARQRELAGDPIEPR
jgi:GH15 family glucan-1,4-alpha-glucosidase